MLPLIAFPIDLTRTAAALTGINKNLVRIADALDRLAPPLPDSDRKPYQAGLSDLRYTDQKSIIPIREELARFAEEHAVAIDSEAFLNSIIQYERDVAQVYGQEAILELPWNKAAGGSLFGTKATPPGDAGQSNEGGAGATQEPVSDEHEADRQPAP